MTAASLTVIFLTAGIVLGRLRWVTYPGAVVGMGLVFGLLLWQFRQRREVSVTLLMVMLLMTGMVLSAMAWAETAPGKEWPLPDSDSWEGTIVGMPRIGGDRTGWVVRSEAGLVQVTVPGRQTEMLPGDRVRFGSVPQPPKGNSNPGEFDQRFHLALRKIPWILYVDSEEAWQCSAAGRPGLRRIGAALAFRWLGIYEATLPPTEGALLASLVLGQRDALDPYLMGNFHLLGLGHLLAVSGFHVAYALLLAETAGKFLGLRGAWLRLLKLVGVWLFAVTAGLQTGVVRAALMVTIALGAQHWQRNPNPGSTLSCTALCLLAVQPLLLFDPGFQLSLAATAGIILALPLLRSLPGGLGGKLLRAVCLSLLVQAAVLPVYTFHFNRLVWTVSLTQLLAAPLAGLAVLLGLVAGWAGMIYLPMAMGVNQIAFRVLNVLIFLVEKSSCWPWHGWSVPSPGLWLVMGWYGLLALFFHQNPAARMPRWVPQRRVVVLLMLLLVGITTGWSRWQPFPEPVRVTVLDVGQGDALVIQTRCGNTLLVDGGNRWEGDFGIVDQGSRVVVPFLRQAGVNRLDSLYSHAHDDHSGGLIAVVASGKVRAMWGPKMPGTTANHWLLQEALSDQGLVLQVLQRGDRLTIGETLVVEVLGPPPEGILGAAGDLNNHSLVLMLKTGHHKMLLTGDLEREGIRWLMAQGDCLQADILKVPHHGSRSSYDEDFYRAVLPRLAVIPVGRNRFGHPGANVVAFLTEHTEGLYRTDRDGAVQFRFFADRIKIEHFHDKKTIWH